MTQKKKKVPLKKIEKDIKDTDDKPQNKPNFLELINDPLTQSILGGVKDMFGKEEKELDPNMCEITIKAPSEIVLKLFNRD